MIYESNNQFFPSAYKINNITHNLVWEGRRLKQFGLETYKYDENGIRISKLGKDDEIKFYLEGNKIVASIRNFMYHTENMIVNTYFSYDSNDSIVGLHIKGKD